MGNDEDVRSPVHILQELGFTLKRVGDEFHGAAAVFPEMYVPGTTSLRASILATWADTAAGHLALDRLAPRVPVTLELDVHVYSQHHAYSDVRAISRTIKAGRSVFVASVDFTDEHGVPVAVAMASFMVAPDPRVTLHRRDVLETVGSQHPRLQIPFAERAGCERRAPGVAVLRRSDDGLNAANSVNGGLIALAVEEAALSATPETTLCSMALRFLRPVRVGPAIASADIHAGVGRVEVRDANDDRLAVVATTRAFAAEAERAA